LSSTLNFDNIALRIKIFKKVSTSSYTFVGNENMLWIVKTSKNEWLSFSCIELAPWTCDYSALFWQKMHSVQNWKETLLVYFTQCNIQSKQCVLCLLG